MNACQNNFNGKITHFLQGNLWRKMKDLHGDKLVLPLAVDFDDYEPNNALGSHAGDQSLGALYTGPQN